MTENCSRREGSFGTKQQVKLWEEDKNGHREVTGKNCDQMIGSNTKDGHLLAIRSHLILHRIKPGIMAPKDPRQNVGFSSNPQDLANRRLYERMWYQEIYERQHWSNSRFTVLMLVTSGVCLLFSDMFKGLFM